MKVDMGGIVTPDAHGPRVERRPPLAAGREVMRLVSWDVRDFKSIAEASLRLPPLTVLAGSNSSGKSSLLQSLLFLGQSAMLSAPVLNGALARFGEPNDLIRNGMKSLTLGVDLLVQLDGGGSTPSRVRMELILKGQGRDLVTSELHVTTADDEILLSATSSRIREADIAEINAPSAGPASALLRVTMLGDKTAPAHTYVAMSGLHPDTLVYKQNLERVRNQLRRQYNLKELRKDPDLIRQFASELRDAGAVLQTATEESLEAESIEWLKRFSRRTPSANIRVLQDSPPERLNELLDLLALSIARSEWVALPLARYRYPYGATSISRRFSWPSGSSLPLPYLKAVTATSAGATVIRALSQQVKYLGPLREEPQVLSSSRGVRHPALPVGLSGELTADVLVRRKSDMVSFGQPDGTVQTASLAAAVTMWVAYLGIGERVTVLDQGKLGQGLRVVINGVERDLTTIGVGASQLLPVIVGGLSVDDGSVFLVEQPELHLHPAVQSRLADFFLYARPTVKFVVETHSEYLITRIRRRVAECRTSARKIDVLFADQLMGRTSFRLLGLTDAGSFMEWPTGFFDTQDLESREIIRAARRKLGSD